MSPFDMLRRERARFILGNEDDNADMRRATSRGGAAI